MQNRPPFCRVNRRCCETSRFVRKLRGFPRSLGIARVLPPPGQHPPGGHRFPRPGASNIPAVFFLPPGKAKAPNVPTRKIRTFVFNVNVALAMKMDLPVPGSPWSPSPGSWGGIWGSRGWWVPAPQRRCSRGSGRAGWQRVPPHPLMGRAVGCVPPRSSWRADLVYLRVRVAVEKFAFFPPLGLSDLVFRGALGAVSSCKHRRFWHCQGSPIGRCRTRQLPGEPLRSGLPWGHPTGHPSCPHAPGDTRGR